MHVQRGITRSTDRRLTESLSIQVGYFLLMPQQVFFLCERFSTCLTTKSRRSFHNGMNASSMASMRLLNKLLISELDYEVRCHVCLNVCMCPTIIKSLPHAMLDGRTGQLPLLPKKYWWTAIRLIFPVSRTVWYKVTILGPHQWSDKKWHVHQ